MTGAFYRCSELAISLMSYSIGDYRTTCPRCSHLRKTPNRKDRCMVVTVTADAILWKCHHCGDAGGARTGVGNSARSRPEPPKTTPADDTADRIRSALKRWDAARDPRGTLVETYLTARSLALPDCPDIRFHPCCQFRLFEDESVVGFPAMLALMRDIASDQPRAIHKTALKADGSGKADILKPKRMQGIALGTAIKLSADSEVTDGLGVAEGIETALSVLGSGWAPIWCLGSAGAIERFPVLPGVASLTIFADADKDGIEKAKPCRKRWRDAGCECRIILPPRDGQDWNDVIAGAA